jgi:MFS family permease
VRGLRFRPGQMISSLHQRNYRLFFFGQLISVAGTWMQTVAQSFVVLDLTHSGTQLGLTSAARFLPMFLFGPMGGVFADRMDKRRVLYVTQSLSGLLAGVFAILIATHSIRLWIVYLLAIALGFVNVFDNPARQSFISEMVSAGDLPNAVTLNSVAMNMARVFGAALGGVIAAAIGLALCFACNALSFAAVLVSLAAMHRSELFPAARVPRRKRQVRQGPRPVPGRRRLGHRHPGCGRRAEPHPGTGGPGLRRIRQHHLQLAGQDHASARRQAGYARPGDGSAGSWRCPRWPGSTAAPRTAIPR